MGWDGTKKSGSGWGRLTVAGGRLEKSLFSRCFPRAKRAFSARKCARDYERIVLASSRIICCSRRRRFGVEAPPWGACVHHPHSPEDQRESPVSTFPNFPSVSAVTSSRVVGVFGSVRGWKRKKLSLFFLPWFYWGVFPPFECFVPQLMGVALCEKFGVIWVWKF